LAPKVYFRIGDRIEAIIAREVVAKGHNHRFRERERWGFELDSHPFTFYGALHQERIEGKKQPLGMTAS